MANLIDYILDLFRSPEVAADFVNNPDQALRSAGLANVSPAQVQAVAATAAPSLALGNGDPIAGLQRAVAERHGIENSFLSPQTSFAPQTNTEFASHNATQLASNNDTSLLSPDQHAGANAQQGAFNLGFGDITLGDKSTNTATDGGVVVGGDSSGDIVSGDGAVLGDGNEVQNGDITAGTGANVNTGDGDIDDRGTTVTGGGDNIQGNDGPVIKDVDMSGGNGGGATSSSSGGGLLGGGNDSQANAGGGGGGGSIILTDSHDVGGNNTEVGGDVSGSGGIDNSRHDHQDNSDNSGQDNSDNSGQDNSDNSGQDNSDNSTHDDHTGSGNEVDVSVI